MTDQAPDTTDPLYGMVRMTEHGPRDVIVPWSQMTDEERRQAWAEHERAYGTRDDRKDSK